MPRTFNRSPFTVPSPSKNDVEDYFFTHSNFKGLSNNKNFLLANQETFSSCDNVYVDSEGLLKSRPCLQKETLVVTLENGDITLDDILDVWTYGDVTVYHTDGKLTFSNNNHQNGVQIDIGTEVKLVLTENKIFIFETDKLRYYDVDENTVSTNKECVEKYIHIPVTKLITNGIITDLESENELTSAYGTKYLFDSILNANFNILIGKIVKVKLDNVEYDLEFVPDNEQVFVQKMSNLTFDYSNISISDVGSMIIAEKLTDSSYNIHYTINGKTFTTIDTLDNAISVPVISSDGHYICYPSENNFYVYKVVDDTSTAIPLGVWSTLLDVIDNTSYEAWVKAGLTFTDKTFIKMISFDNFATVCEFNGTLSCIVSHAGDYHSYKIYNYDRIVYVRPSDLVFTRTLQNVNIDGEHVITNATYYYFDDKETYSIHKTPRLKIMRQDGKYYLVGDILYMYHGVSGVYSKTWIIDIPIHAGTTNLVLDGLSIDINIDDNSGVATVRYETPSDHVMKVDDEYALGSSYSVYASGLCPLDMYSDADGFFVVMNTGEICTVDKFCTDRVNYLCKPWLSEFVASNYDVAINSSNVYFTAPYGSELHLYVYKHEQASSNSWENYTYYNKQPLDDSTQSIVSNTGKVLTEKALYISGKSIPLLFEASPIKVTKDGIFLSKDKFIYSSVLDNLVEVTEITPGEIKYIVPEYVSEIDNFYFAKDKKLYISSYPSDGEFRWYFPKISTETFDYSISNIHPISSTEMAVFLNDSIYYIQRSEAGYLYYKSKIQVGCEKGTDVITSFDGKYIIFTSDRGLVALSYQDFVASTEQTLTYLSDDIHETFKLYNTNSPVKLFKYDFWIICYKENASTYLLFDIRNNSWWPMTLPYQTSKFITTGHTAKVLCSGKLYNIVAGEDDYYDYDGTKTDINWHVTSQKLHLNAPNYYKHISNITLTSVLDTNKEIYLDLTLYNYRKKMHQSEIESFKFDVDSIRTYVKRLNYSKVNEFQYLLTSNINDAADESEAVEVPKVPLSLSSITIKYKISGQVR